MSTRSKKALTYLGEIAAGLIIVLMVLLFLRNPAQSQTPNEEPRDTPRNSAPKNDAAKALPTDVAEYLTEHADRFMENMEDGDTKEMLADLEEEGTPLDEPDLKKPLLLDLPLAEIENNELLEIAMILEDPIGPGAGWYPLDQQTALAGGLIDGNGPLPRNGQMNYHLPNRNTIGTSDGGATVASSISPPITFDNTPIINENNDWDYGTADNPEAPTDPVPEPATLLLLAVGSGMLFGKRKCRG